MTILYPPWHLSETPLYHITHINNLQCILNSRSLQSKNSLKAIIYESIANQDIQDKRSGTMVSKPPFGTLHDYVPFYFAPRSPMLYVNYTNSDQTIKQPNKVLPNAKPQQDIIYFVTQAELIHQNKISYVFYDQHAVKCLANCYTDVKDLDKINWNIFYDQPCLGSYSKWWDNKPDNPSRINRKEIRQAEFLIHKQLELMHIIKIAVMTKDVEHKVLKVLDETKIELPVSVERDWYY